MQSPTIAIGGDDNGKDIKAPHDRRQVLRARGPVRDEHAQLRGSLFILRGQLAPSSAICTSMIIGSAGWESRS